MPIDRAHRDESRGLDRAAGSTSPAPGKIGLTQRLPGGRGSSGEIAHPCLFTVQPMAVQAAPVDDAFGLHLPRSTIQDRAADGVRGAGSVLPHAEQVQASFGHHDLSNVRAHVGGAAGEAAVAIGARAYATGHHVAFATDPDLHDAAHEAAHVVQQRSGVQLQGGVGESDDVYERHADEVADRVTRGESAEELLDVHAGQGTGVSAATQMVQMLEYDDLAVGHYYEVEGHTFPLYLRTKRRGGGATMRMDDKVGPELEVAFDKVKKEVEAPTEPPSADEAKSRSVLGAIWDAHARVKRVIAALAPLVEDAFDPKQLSPRIGAALKRDGRDVLLAFRANLIKIRDGLAPQLARSDLLFMIPDGKASPMGETAVTDQRAGTITLYKAFFDATRIARGNTITHEMVHRQLRVEDQAYRTTRLFEYLKPEFRLQNPDSYVQLLNEIDPAGGGDVKPPPGFEVGGDVQNVDASALKLDVAIVQHVAQRASYFLAACAGELVGGFPAFIQQSDHLKAYLGVIRGNDTWKTKKDDAKALSDWATTVKASAQVVAHALAANVKIVGTTDKKEEAGFADGPDGYLVTLHTGAADVRFWLFGKLLQKLNINDGLQFRWKLACAVVEAIEPFGAKIGPPLDDID